MENVYYTRDEIKYQQISKMYMKLKLLASYFVLQLLRNSLNHMKFKLKQIIY